MVNPWSWWSVSFDFHTECLAVLFIALLAWDLSHGRRRAWLWIPLLVACGDVAGTYIFGLGLGLAIGVRGQRMRGAIVGALGIVAVLGISAIHGNLGSGHGLQAYDYLAAPGSTGSLTLTQLLAGLATHPAAVLAKMWSKRVDIWANVGSSGLLGAAFLPLLPITARPARRRDRECWPGWPGDEAQYAWPVAVQRMGAIPGQVRWRPEGERLEVRVWTPGGDTVSVYSAQLRTLSHP